MTATVRPRKRLVVLVSIGFAALAALVGVGLYGLVLAPAPTTPTTADDPTPASPSTSVAGPTPPSATLPPIRSTTNAESFARDAARALIDWDTATDFTPADHAQVVVDAGDLSGTETAGLAADVRSYLPTAAAWSTLRTYSTRQWITIDEVFVPASWPEAEAQAAPGQLLPGTIAYTVKGTRNRAGVVGTQPQETSRPITFTLFIACEPSFDVCRLLRLSEVDNPLP